MSIFVSYDGVTGESTDANHQGWMDVKEIQWGVSRKITANAATRSDRESANAEITDLELIRHADRGTPQLFMEACRGRGRAVVIHLTKTGDGSGSDIYMEYRLKNALISDYVVEANGQDETRPLEQITISFVAMEVRYTPHDDDGNAQAPIAVGFDTSANAMR